jgi:maleate isomerase
VHGYLTEAGFEIVRLVGMKCASPFAIAEVPPSTLRRVLRDIDSADVDAILQVGTNLANGAVAAEAERWLEKPVLALNVVTYWDALRRIGIEDRVYGCGRILEEF